MMAVTVEDEKLSKFLETFPTPLHHKQPESCDHFWVFWSQDEGSQIRSSSTDLGTWRIHEKIKSAFSKAIHSEEVVVQFWAPVTIWGRRLLSTSGQPFAVSHLDKGLEKYRLRSLEYQYNINVNNELDIDEEDPDTMIISGAPVTAFLNRHPEMVDVFQGKRVHQRSALARYALECGLETSCMLPIFCPSQSSSCCIGVVEYSISLLWPGLEYLKQMNRALEEVGLRMFHVRELIPYQTIDGLKHARDEIETALKIICPSHNISLAQVWIAYEDKNYVPFSFFLEDAQKKCMLALKLTGYGVDVDFVGLRWIYMEYYDFCDMFPLKMGEGLVEKTLQDHKPRFCKHISKLSNANLMRLLSYDGESSGFAICLRSSHTGQFDYAFEFIWRPNSNYVVLMEALLLTLKRCLPSFKFASGAKLDDELHVISIKNSTRSEIKFLKIFQGNQLSPIPLVPEALEEGRRKPVVEDYVTPLEMRCKTTPIPLPREVIEQQFGNTMKEAAENLKVSLSTLKRKCKALGISEWQGPNLVKKKVYDPNNNQNNGALQDPLAVNLNDNTLTLKVECADDMIKFHLHISQATFVTVGREIGKKFKLALGSYKLKYYDEDGDWILLTSDQDMSDCIKSYRNSDQDVIRLQVVPDTESEPSGFI